VTVKALYVDKMKQSALFIVERLTNTAVYYESGAVGAGVGIAKWRQRIADTNQCDAELIKPTMQPAS